MRTVTANEVEEQLGLLVEAVESREAPSVLIAQDGLPVAMLLSVQKAEMAILGAYAHGVLSREVAMQQLGLEWYGELLQRMNAHGIRRPSLSSEDMRVMRESTDSVFSRPTIKQSILPARYRHILVLLTCRR